jgi:hypothetical protein
MAITVSELAAVIDNAGASNPLTASKTFTAGSSVLVFYSTGGAGLTPVVTDGGNTYNQKSYVINTTSTNLKTWCFLAENVTGGAKTISIAGVGGYAQGMHVFELLGADASSFDAVDEFEGLSNLDLYAAEAGGITISAGALAFAFYVPDRDVTSVTVSGYTSGTTSNVNGIQ